MFLLYFKNSGLFYYSITPEKLSLKADRRLLHIIWQKLNTFAEKQPVIVRMIPSETLDENELRIELLLSLCLSEL